MQQPVVIVGLGQLGGVFAHGLLKAGRPVVPITRDYNMARQHREVNNPGLVMICVGEEQLDGVLRQLPDAWKDRVGLVQNELLPRNWRRAGVTDPTVAIVWFEKKAGGAAKPLIETVIHGPCAGLLHAALEQLEIPARIIDDDDELLLELVAKNLYILTLNIAGLDVGGTVETLWSTHKALATAVFDEVLAIQQGLLGKELDRATLLARFEEAVAADPGHGCKGRTAPGRLRRVLTQARSLSVEVPTLERLEAALD